MNMLSKLSAALWLISTLASTPAMANFVGKISAGCGVGSREFNDIGGLVSCYKTGTDSFNDGSGDYYWSIQSTATSNYEWGGLRTSGDVVFDGLLEAATGAPVGASVGTAAVAQIQDRLRFRFPTVATGSKLTMKTTAVFHGAFREGVDESKFYDNNSANMTARFSVSGFGAASGPDMAAAINISNGVITTFGSPDVANVFTNHFVTVNSNGDFFTSVLLDLNTYISLANGKVGETVGIGSGKLGADFSSTAGVVSIEFFDAQDRFVDYTLTTETGSFAFLTPVPEPASSAMMLLGLCAVAGFAQRRRSRAVT